MNKLPVGKTIVAAYAFTFNNLGAIIGYIWIPMLIVTVIGFFAQSTYIDAIITYASVKNPSYIGPAFMWLMLFLLTALLGNAMMLVPVLELALGKRSDHVMAHFALGPPEWRMFGGYLALMGVALVFGFVVALVDGALAKAATMVGGAVASDAASALVLLVALIVYAAVLLRLAFFIPAVTLLESKIDLGRGWQLLQGNTARLLVAIVAIALPVGVLYFGAEIALFGVKAVLPDVNAQATALPSLADMREMRARMPFTEALGFFIAPLTVGLNAGAVAYAYRALIAPAASNESAPQ